MCMEENKQLQPKELNNQDNQDKKKENKKTLKTVIISVICTLLFVVLILLLVILVLKKCQPQSGGLSSNNDSSSETYNYDKTKLDNVFKKIVTKHMQAEVFDDDTITDVLAVTYTDDGANFDLDISVRSASKIYYYHLDNSSYTGYDNFVSYILDVDYDSKVGIPLEGDEANLTFLPIVGDTITTDKPCKYAITENYAGTAKYLSGFYSDDSGFHVYLKKELVSSSPFDEEADKVIGSSDILFGYYNSIKPVA